MNLMVQQEQLNPYFYIYPKGFAEHLKMQNPEETDFGPDIGPMVQDERKRRQQQS